MAQLVARPGLAEKAPPVLFSADATIDVTIEGPLKAINDDRSDDADYRPAVWRYVEPGSATEVSLDVGIRTRGKFRRDKETCAFPPLRINFKKKQVEGTLFEGQDKLKLVTHCRDSRYFTTHLMNEYLAYRTLNVLTDRSLRVRLLNVRYVMTDRRNKVIERHAFLLEPEKHMARRNGARVRSSAHIGHAQLDPDYSNLIEVFQFMIGNTDWSMIRGPEPGDCCHNFILVSADDELYYSVPYDFDFSGVVDAPYATPPSDIRIKSVRQRRYRGRCRPQPMLEQTIARFEQSRAAIYALYEDHPALRDADARRTLKYYDAFYKIIGNPKKRRQHIEQRCFASKASDD